LALTSPKSGGRSVGIVRLRTEATEFFFLSPCRQKSNVFSKDNTFGKLFSSAFGTSISNETYEL
jgi:hypothetical protein